MTVRAVSESWDNQVTDLGEREASLVDVGLEHRDLRLGLLLQLLIQALASLLCGA